MSRLRFCCLCCAALCIALGCGRVYAASSLAERALAADVKKTSSSRVVAVSASEQRSAARGAQIKKTGSAKDSGAGKRLQNTRAEISVKGAKPVRKRTGGRKIYVEPLPVSLSLPQSGIASWVGKSFHGKPVSNGERYDLSAFTAAHIFAPFNSILKVTEINGGRSVLVRVNDRGPYVRGRVIDLSLAAAQHLGYAAKGLATVRIELVGDDADPALNYYILLSPGNTLFLRGFGPFKRFDDAAGLFASLTKNYPDAQLVALKEKS